MKHIFKYDRIFVAYELKGNQYPIRGAEYFTPEQEAFFEQNPTASASEVKALKMNEPPVPEPMDTETYRQQVLTELSDLSLRTIADLYPQYKVNNALLKIYDDEKSVEILEGVKKYSLLCRNEYFRLETLINEAEDIASIDEIKVSNQYAVIVEQYNAKNNNDDNSNEPVSPDIAIK
jgi:hypothetical protein